MPTASVYRAPFELVGLSLVSVCGDASGGQTLLDVTIGSATTNPKCEPRSRERCR